MRLAMFEFALCALLAPGVAQAAWSDDPTVNLPVTTATGHQRYPGAIPDGSGGVFIAWYDEETTTIRVQHVEASGNIDGTWLHSGRSAGPGQSFGSQDPPSMVPDLSGGLIVVFESTQYASRWHPYGNRVSGTGAIVSPWATSGLPFCQSLYNQHDPVAQSDGAGGAIAVWEDFRGAKKYDIVTARIQSNGVTSPSSPYPGTYVCSAIEDQLDPHSVPDGAGGQIVFWDDRRAANPDIYAHHVLADGSVDGAWPINGAAVMTSGAWEERPSPLADGAGGAFFAFRRGDLFVHHLLADGTLDPVWPASGLQIGTYDQRAEILSDGAGGMLVAWIESGVRVQRVTANGDIFAGWPAGGRVLPGASPDGGLHAIAAVSDGAHGVLLAWSDYRDVSESSTSIYSHHVLASSDLDPAWPSEGLAVCTAAGGQHFPVMVADGAGRAIVVWEDIRDGDYDVYAQRIPYGATAAVMPQVDAPRWIRVTPNPSLVYATISWSLPGISNARLVILDVSGRHVRDVAQGPFAAGEQHSTWDLKDAAGRRVPPGLYFARFEGGGERATQRFVVQH